jgi:FG-GAP-like repeat/Bacterial Ig domain/FG-GAP repeat
VPKSTGSGNLALADAVSQQVHAFHFRQAVGDVDGDGRPDLVTSHHDSGNGSPGRFGVFLNRFDGVPLGPTGAFPNTILGTNANAYFKTTGAVAGDLELADLNNDGKLDVVVSDFNLTSVAICQNQSSPGLVSFGNVFRFSTGGANAAVGVAVGDLDGDGRLDIVAATGPTAIKVLRNTHAGGNLNSSSFASGVPVIHGPWRSVAVGDLNGDGRLDIVAGSWESGAFVVLKNTGTGPGVLAFSQHFYPDTGAAGSFDLKLADFDRDGRIDILFPDNSENPVMRVVRNTVTAGVIDASSFATVLTIAGPDAIAAPFGAVGELTGDDRPEGVFSRAASGPLNILLNSSATGVPGASRVDGAALPEATWAIDVADFDGDGRNDIVTSTPNGTCSVYLIRNLGNRVPVVGDDFAFCTTNGVLIDVLENDTDGDGQALVITGVTQSASGGVASIQGNKIFYDPLGEVITTPRTFTYTVTDGEFPQSANVTIYRNPALGFTYTGHLIDTDGTTIRGLLTLRLARAGGQFTGEIFIGPKRYGLKGSFSRESPSPAVAGASRTNPGIPVRISAGPLDGIGIPQVAFSVAGTVPDTRWRGLAERSPYFRLSTGSLVSPAAGKYTMLFEQPAGSAQPIVAGCCSAIVRPAAAATFAGRQGNGLALTTRGYLLAGGRMPFYAPVARGSMHQSLGGMLVFAPTVDADVTGTVLWNVPAGFDSRVPGGLARTYPVVGARYSTALTRFSPPNLMLDYNSTGDATFSFDLPSSSRVVDVFRNIGTVQAIGGPVPLPRVTFAPSTGYYSGTFTDPPTTASARFQGFVIRHPAQNRGNGYVLDSDRLGNVSLLPSP